MQFNSSSNSRGVAVLFRNSLEFEILERAADPQENALLLKLKIKGKELIVGSVYGPNDNDFENFFEFLRANLTRWAGIPCIIGGDWNATPSYEPVVTNPDVIFMRNIPSRIRSEHVETLSTDCDLSDPFRTLHPDLKEFSYYPSGQLRKNRSRIDFFLVSSDLYEFIESCTIAQSQSRTE
jgi:exonuclease III